MKRYVFFTVVLVVLFAIYLTYQFQESMHTLVFFGINVTLPIALWVILPMLAVSFFSILHLAFYGFKNFLSSKAIAKDKLAFSKIAKSALLKQEFEGKYKTDLFALPEKMLSLLSKPSEGESLEDEELKNICSILVELENGEVVNLKPYKLSKDNPLVIKNAFNQLKKDPKSASEVIKTCSNMESELGKAAFDALVQNASYTEIKRHNIPLNADQAITLLKRHIEQDDTLFMADKDIEELLSSSELSESEYVQSAKVLKKKLNPEFLVSIYEKIYNEHSQAVKAYVYVLFELQMLDKAREVLANMDEEDAQAFNSYLFLRDNGRKTDIAYFI